MTTPSAPDQAALPTFPFPGGAGGEFPAELRRLLAEPTLTKVMLPSGHQAWLAAHFEHVRAVGADPRFSRALAMRPGSPAIGPISQSLPVALPIIFNIDPPEHTRIRKLIAGAFTQRKIAGFRPRIEQIVAAQIRMLADCGPPADLVQNFSAVIPGAVICDLLGLPVADGERIRRLAEGMLAVSGRTPDEVADIRDEVLGYMIQLIADRRAHPGQDLLSAIIAARDEDDKLSELELIVLCGTLFIAGNQSTINTMSNLVLTLLEHPAELAWLRDHPDLLPVAVEELLRFFPRPDGGRQIRIATTDVEVGGVTVREGDAVLVSHTAANRDPAAFDEPDRLDLGRPDNHHLAFGAGAHFCLGAHLARLELQTAIGALLRHFPGLRLAIPAEQLPWSDAGTHWALTELMVTW